MDSGLRYETNFVIKKFCELPEEKKERLFGLINSKKEEEIVASGKTLVDFICDNFEEMGRFVGPFDGWLISPEDYPKKAVFFWSFFKDNLQKTESGLIINPVL